MFVSSADMEAWICLKQFEWSLIYNLINNGPKSEPCGAPHVQMRICSLNYACLHSFA